MGGWLSSSLDAMIDDFDSNPKLCEDGLVVHQKPRSSHSIAITHNLIYIEVETLFMITSLCCA